MSDLHLEFNYWEPSVMEGEQDQILILAGDILPVKYKLSWEGFLTDMSDRFRYVLFIAGNHEYYKSSVVSGPKKLRAYADALPNVFFLDDGVFGVDGVRFIGSTLWTDMDKMNPMTMYEAKTTMNDYKHIRVGPASAPYQRLLTPAETAAMHITSKRYIFRQVDKGGKCVVISHHSPSYMSCAERYKHSKLNGAYNSELFDDIADRDIALWVHGHLHRTVNYDIVGTQVVTNPRGYHPYDLNPDFNDQFIVEL